MEKFPAPAMPEHFLWPGKNPWDRSLLVSGKMVAFFTGLGLTAFSFFKIKTFSFCSFPVLNDHAHMTLGCTEFKDVAASHRGVG
jgi:hypothetical protein